MIDIHNHLLPALDDGSPDLAETLRMCRIAATDGIRTIAATPHSFNGQFVNEPQGIRHLVRRVNETIEAQGLDLTVVPGMEIRIVPNMMELLEAGKLLALNDGRYLLVEFPVAHVPAAFDKFLAGLSSADYGVVLGHPERNFHIQRNIGWLAEMLERIHSWDLVVQVSADSLMGLAGRAAYRTALKLLKKKLVHIVATDAHSSVDRPPKLSKAVAAAARIVGSEKARQLVEDIPHAVLTGTGFPSMEEPRAQRKWWRLF